MAFAGFAEMMRRRKTLGGGYPVVKVQN